jgi:hypothetical protein
MKTRLLFGAVALLAATLAHAAPKATAAARAAKPPVIDGSLGDACWTDAPTIRDFVLLGGDAPAKEQTVVKVACDDTALYLGIVCRESQMGKLVATQTTRGPAVCSDDCVEIFLDPNHDRFNYVHFVVNPNGAAYDESGDGAGVAADWNAVWEVKTSRGADSWTAEVRIPLAILGVSTKVGETWGFNVCRSEKPAAELSCWSQTGAKFAAPGAFGDLTGLKVDFRPYLVTVGALNWGQAILGGNTAQVKVTNDGPAEREFAVRLTVTPPNEAPRPAEAPAGRLAAGASVTLSLAYQLFEAGEHAVSIEVLDAAGGGRVVAATGKRMSVAPLAEFAVFKSFYRDDVAVRYQVNAQAADLGKYRLQAVLLAAPGTAPALATETVRRLAQPNGEVRFATTTLAAGDYRIRADLLDAAGQPVAGKDLEFSVLRQPGAARRVDIDAQNFLRVNGKRCFPVGSYASPGSEKGVRDLAAAGFTLIQSGALPPAPMQVLLDKAQQYGLMVWVSLGATLDFSKDAEKKRQELEPLVAAVGNHPALLLWESIDEPAWGSQSAEGLYAGYKFLRALDQNHPIWTNHAPRNLISTLAYFNRATDLAGCDIYPVPEPQSHSNLPNRTLHVTGDETDKSVASVNGDKPVIMVLQGFGWAELGGMRGAKNGAILPTFAESRFMAYDAILHGARGINYWGTAYTEKPSRFYNELCALVSELAALEPVLTADIVTGKRAGSVVSADAAVQMMRRSVGGKTFVIAINTRNEERQAEFSVPKLAAKELRVLFEGRAVPAPRGRFSDAFGPYATHIYSDDPSFDPKRKDVAAELARPAPDDLPLREPGNLIANASFEVDADDDQVPDNWTANYPFTMQVSEEQAHAGKRSVMLSSTTKDFAPLAVEHGLPGLKPDGSYVLSSWVKTDRPDLEFRIYVEWAGWHGAVLPWTKGTGEWQRVEIPFRSEPAAVGTIYAVVQIKGEGRGWFDEVAVKETPTP